MKVWQVNVMLVSDSTNSKYTINVTGFEINNNNNIMTWAGQGWLGEIYII